MGSAAALGPADDVIPRHVCQEEGQPGCQEGGGGWHI